MLSWREESWRARAIAPRVPAVATREKDNQGLPGNARYVEGCRLKHAAKCLLAFLQGWQKWGARPHGSAPGWFATALRRANVKGELRRSGSYRPGSRSEPEA